MQKGVVIPKMLVNVPLAEALPGVHGKTDSFHEDLIPQSNINGKNKTAHLSNWSHSYPLN